MTLTPREMTIIRARAATLPKRRHTDTADLSAELADLLREPPRDPEALPCTREAERLLVPDADLPKPGRTEQVIGVALAVGALVAVVAVVGLLL